MSRVGEPWTSHWNQWRQCTKCAIGLRAFRHVFFRGTIPCDVLLIGEGPGKTENILGYPFVGRAGELLDEWLEPYTSSLKFCITNLVLCRPTEHYAGKISNRPPTEEEKDNCRPRLDEFIKIAQSRAVILLGKHAAQAEIICEKKLAMYHPAYVLREGGKGTAADRRERKKLATFLEEIL